MSSTPAQRKMAGLFALSALLLAAVALAAVAGARWGRPERTVVVAVREESVAGLTEGGKVRIWGLDAGVVQSLRLHPSDPRVVIIETSLDTAFPLHRDAEATLEVFGLTGLKVLEIRPGSHLQPPLDDGDTIWTRPGIVGGILIQLDSISRATNVVLQRLAGLSGGQNPEHIDSIVVDVRRTTQAVSELAVSMRDAGFATDIREALGSLRGTIAGVDSTLRTGGVANVLRRTDSAALAVQSTAVRADRVLMRSQPELQRSLEDLSIVLRNLAEFSDKIRDDPSLLVRGQEREQP